MCTNPNLAVRAAAPGWGGGQSRSLSHVTICLQTAVGENIVLPSDEMWLCDLDTSTW